MIHADVQVAGILQGVADHLLQQQFFLRYRQGHPVDCPLAAEPLRQVRVVVAGDAVRAQRIYLAQGLPHGVAVLVRQAVDQVEAQRTEVVRADIVHQRRDHFVGLDPVDGLLYQGVEILDAKADAIEAHALEQGDGAGIHRARIYLDRVFPVILVQQPKMAREHVHQLGNLGVVEVGGGAAAPVHLGDGALFADQSGLLFDLLLQVIEIAPGHALLPGDYFVAAAVVTDVLAKRQVQVQGQGRALVVAIPPLPGQILLRGEVLAELGGGWIGGVPGPLAGVLDGQFHVRWVDSVDTGVGFGIGENTVHGSRSGHSRAHISKFGVRER